MILAYILNAVTIAVAILGLAKDWSAHQRTWRRILILSLLLISGVGSEINTYWASGASDQRLRQMKDLQAELAATRQALAIPKAEIEGSLGNVGSRLENLDVKDEQVSLQQDGTVTFVVTSANKATVQAKNGTTYIRICAACEFAEEPSGFQRQSGASAQDRASAFFQWDPYTAHSVTVKVRPPSGSHQFMVSLSTRCENCIFKPAEELLVHF